MPLCCVEEPSVFGEGVLDILDLSAIIDVEDNHVETSFDVNLALLTVTVFEVGIYKVAAREKAEFVKLVKWCKLIVEAGGDVS